MIAGCEGKDNNFKEEIDVNNDGKKDLIWGYRKDIKEAAYEIYLQINLGDFERNLGKDIFTEPILLASFKYKPKNIFFYDMNKDDFIDIIHTKISYERKKHYGDKVTEMRLNDGKGNFGEPISLSIYNSN